MRQVAFIDRTSVFPWDTQAAQCVHMATRASGDVAIIYAYESGVLPIFAAGIA